MKEFSRNIRFELPMCNLPQKSGFLELRAHQLSQGCVCASLPCIVSLILSFQQFVGSSNKSECSSMVSHMFLLQICLFLWPCEKGLYTRNQMNLPPAGGRIVPLHLQKKKNFLNRMSSRNSPLPFILALQGNWMYQAEDSLLWMHSRVSQP